jgi:hypothetical protein
MGSGGVAGYRRDAMDGATRAAGVLRRYVVAKARFKKIAFAESVFIGLTKDIEDGRKAFWFLNGAILIDPKAPAVITADDNDPKFLEASIGGRDDMIGMKAGELNQWREYVLNGGAPPRHPAEC